MLSCILPRAALSISDLLSLLCADGAASALLLERPAPAWPSGTRALLALAASREALERAADGLRGGTLYQQALAAGLDECVLDFLSSVADCEARLLDGDGGGGGEGDKGDEDSLAADALAADADAADATGAMLAPHHVRLALRRHLAAVPAVEAFAGDALRRGLCGGPLLSALYRRAQDGDADVAAAFSALLWRVSQPFLGHVTRWMAYAEVEASASAPEFFVRRLGADASSSAAASALAVVVASNVVDGAARRTGGSDAARPEIRVVAAGGGGGGGGGAGGDEAGTEAEAEAEAAAAAGGEAPG